MTTIDVAERLGVRHRHVRYMAERGIVAPGEQKSPGRGNHRDLTKQQALWLAIAVSCTCGGLDPHVSARIANTLYRCHRNYELMSLGTGVMVRVDLRVLREKLERTEEPHA